MYCDKRSSDNTEVSWFVYFCVTDKTFHYHDLCVSVGWDICWPTVLLKSTVVKVVTGEMLVKLAAEDKILQKTPETSWNMTVMLR